MSTPYTYEGSLMYVFDNYSIKVYHKGLEIKKDFEHLSKIFNESELSLFTNIADRTLRYECTIRTPKLKDLFIKTFRKNCPIFSNLESEIIDKFKNGNLQLMPFRSSYYHKTPEEELF